MKYKLYSEVVFNQDINEYHIKKGDIATIIDKHCQNEKINEPGYTLEIFDGIGNTLNVVTVPESKIKNIKANYILYQTANNICNIICHSEAQRRISQLLATTDFEISHFVSK